MPAPTYHLHLRLTVSAPMPWTLYQPWTPWSMHLKKLGNIYLQKCSENLNGLVKTIPKIYICWGIVSDTNFTNFHQFSPIFGPIFWKCSENLNRLDKTIPKIYICWGIVGDTNFTNFHQFSLIFGPISPISWHIINWLDEMIPKIYICWGIVGDTNFTNFH